MSGLGHVITHPLSSLLNPVRATKRVLGLGGQQATAPPPPVPTLDQASLGSQQLQDVMRRRRGVYANIYAGGQPQSPTSVGVKQLLGT